MKINAFRALLVIGALVGPSLNADQSPEPPRLTLLDAGSGVRQALRYGAKKGDVFAKRFTMRMILTSSVNDVGTPLPPPPTMVIGMDLTVTDVNAAGDVSVDFGYSNVDVIRDPTTSEAAVAALQKSLAAISGIRGRMVMTSRGQTNAFSLELPPGISPSVAQQLSGLNRSLTDAAAWLPEEPIGLGARWRVEQQQNVNGILVNSVRTYTVTAGTGSTVTIAVDVVQTGKEQDVTLADVPRGVNARLESMTGHGSGTLVISAGEIMARRSDISLATETRMTVAGLGPAQRIRQTLGMTFALTDASPQQLGR